jgi:hypothetical protein
LGDGHRLYGELAPFMLECLLEETPMRRPLAILAIAPLALVLNAAACGGGDAEGECAFAGEESGSLSSCGNIEVSASASCEVEVSGGCTAKCTPISFHGECSGRCSGSISASCTASCQGDCSASCEVDPPSFSCQGSCEANCGADCSAHCEAGGNQASCQADCEAACSGECSGSCEGTGGSASCEAKCQASCEGECSVEADIDCHASCYGELQGGCEVACESPDGALYCDGQYVDAGDNFAECIGSLNACLDIEVDASASAACEGGKCSAEAEASCAASIANGPIGKETPWYALGLAALGLGLLRRRR